LHVKETVSGNKLLFLEKSEALRPLRPLAVPAQPEIPLALGAAELQHLSRVFNEHFSSAFGNGIPAK
jgi:hypothetical protein